MLLGIAKVQVNAYVVDGKSKTFSKLVLHLGPVFEEKIQLILV